jgi:hypothetical protein
MAGRMVWNAKFLGGLMLVFLLACSGVAWMERSTLLSWFYIHSLSRASADSRGRWVERVANLGETAIPGLLECLGETDASVCENARAGLERLTQVWGTDDPRTAELALRLSRAFGQFSPAGQRQILDLASGWFAGANGPAENLVTPCARLVGEAAGTPDADVQAGALELCGILLDAAGRAMKRCVRRSGIWCAERCAPAPRAIVCAPSA